MSLFEKLKNKYRPVQLKLYGECLIIPMDEFQKEWERILETEGHTTRVTDYEYKAVYAVSIKKAETYTKEPFPEPERPEPIKNESQKTKNMRAAKESPKWTKPENVRLCKRWRELGNIPKEQKTKQLLPEFPGRTTGAIHQKIIKLSRKPEYQELLKQVEAKPEPAAEPAPLKIIQAPAPEPKPEPAAAPPKEKELTYEEVVQSQIQRLAEDLEKIREQTVDRQMDLQEVIGTMNRKIDDLETTLGEYIEKFDQHEHSIKTGLPLVPP
jgi:hypothetical protein